MVGGKIQAQGRHLKRSLAAMLAGIGVLTFIVLQAAPAAAKNSNPRESCMAPGFAGSYESGANFCSPPGEKELVKIMSELRKSEVFKKQYADNCSHCREKGSEELLGRLSIDAAKIRSEYFRSKATSTIDDSGKFGLVLDDDLSKSLKTASGGDGFSSNYRICRAANECMFVDSVRDYMHRVSWKNDKDLACLKQLQNDAHLIAIQSALNPKDQYLRKRTFVCLSRLRGDLWRYPMLERWPSKYQKCKAASGNPGVSIEGACVTLAGTGAPIDSRVPKGLEDFVKRLKVSTGAEVEELQMGGCFNMRAANEKQTRELSESREDAVLTAANMSNHAEARACDIDALVFRRGAQRVRLEIKKSGPDSLRDALDAYAKTSAIPTIFRTHLTPDRSGKVFGLADWRSLAKVSRPAQMDQRRFERFQLGVSVRNALVDSGFYAVDPFINKEHRDHFHISVPRRDAQWNGLRKSPVEAEFQSACALTRQSGVPVERVEKHFRRKCQ